MDAKSNNSQDQTWLQTSAITLVLFAFADAASAQWVEIRAMEKDQSLTHPVNSGFVTFSEVRWDVHNSYQDDILIEWSMEAFESSKGSSRTTPKADVGLSLRLRNGGPRNAWHISQPIDQSSLSRGDTTASVTAVGTHQGSATFGVTVAFIPSGSSIPAAGRYESRLIGTISAP